MGAGFLCKKNMAQRGEVICPSSPALGEGLRPKPWTAWNGPNQGLSERRREASPQQDRDPLLKWQPPGQGSFMPGPHQEHPMAGSGKAASPSDTHSGRQHHPVTPGSVSNQLGGLR